MLEDFAVIGNHSLATDFDILGNIKLIFTSILVLIFDFYCHGYPYLPYMVNPSQLSS